MTKKIERYIISVDHELVTDDYGSIVLFTDEQARDYDELWSG